MVVALACMVCLQLMLRFIVELEVLRLRDRHACMCEFNVRTCFWDLTDHVLINCDCVCMRMTALLRVNMLKQLGGWHVCYWI
jgi:hypothetical protein